MERKPTYIKFVHPINEQNIRKLLGIVQNEITQGTQKIILLISSTGGNVYWGVTASEFLKGVPIEIDTHAFGRVNSVAVSIFCSGNRRYSTPYSTFMMHGVGFNATNNQRFDYKALDEKVKSISNDDINIARIIAESCDKDENDVLKMMHDYTQFSAEEAIEFRLVHEIKEELFESGSKVVEI